MSQWLESKPVKVTDRMVKGITFKSTKSKPLWDDETKAVLNKIYEDYRLESEALMDKIKSQHVEWLSRRPVNGKA